LFEGLRRNVVIGEQLRRRRRSCRIRLRRKMRRRKYLNNETINI